MIKTLLDDFDVVDPTMAIEEELTPISQELSSSPPHEMFGENETNADLEEWADKHAHNSTHRPDLDEYDGLTDDVNYGSRMHYVSKLLP